MTTITPTKVDPKKKYQIIKNDEPSPTSYDVDSSYKSTQVSKPKFFISKSKITMLSDKAAKDKSYVPGVGSYEFEKSYDRITKGASKGWK